MIGICYFEYEGMEYWIKDELLGFVFLNMKKLDMIREMKMNEWKDEF